MNVAGVIGAGAWGTALAQMCARAGLETTLWALEPDVVRSIRGSRRNGVFLPSITLDPHIEATGDMADLAKADVVFSAAPAQFTRLTLTQAAPHLKRGVPIILCAKGVEAGSLKLMSQVAAEAAPGHPILVLSGPSFAEEVARGLPTAVTLACPELELCEVVARVIASPVFRPYISGDIIGAQAGGALKNVLAIACGIVLGRSLGRSAHAALITRGFAELTRLGVALGGKSETLSGLCGLGDLVLTCSSEMSRNMSVGLALGRGATLERALAGKLSVAEGVASAPAVRDLAARMGVETPICNAVAAILAGEIGMETAIAGLLSRPLKAELDSASSLPTI